MEQNINWQPGLLSLLVSVWCFGHGQVEGSDLRNMTQNHLSWTITKSVSSIDKQRVDLAPGTPHMFVYIYYIIIIIVIIIIVIIIINIYIYDMYTYDQSLVVLKKSSLPDIGYCPCFSHKIEGLNYPFQSVGDLWWLLRMDTITITKFDHVIKGKPNKNQRFWVL